MKENIIRKYADILAAWAVAVLWALGVVAIYASYNSSLDPDYVFFVEIYTKYWGGALCAVGAVLLVSAIVQTLGYTTRELIAVKYTVAISVLAFEMIASCYPPVGWLGAFGKGNLVLFFFLMLLFGVLCLCAEWHFCRARKLTVRSGWNSVGNAAPWMMVCLYLYPLSLSTALIFDYELAPRGFLLTSIGIFGVMAFTVFMAILQRKGNKYALKIRYAGNFLVDFLFIVGWVAGWVVVFGYFDPESALFALALAATVAAFHIFCLYAERKAAVVQE
ncbi:MAG: hypothetical protein J6D37_08910 [Clostridia bacterium]|nr:hypothetical protein [Clostridia bacterium]